MEHQKLIKVSYLYCIYFTVHTLHKCQLQNSSDQIVDKQQGWISSSHNKLNCLCNANGSAGFKMLAFTNSRLSTDNCRAGVNICMPLVKQL